MKINSLKIIPVPMYFARSNTYIYTFKKQIILQKSQKAKLLTEVKQQRVDCKSMCSTYLVECFSRNTYDVRLKISFSANNSKKICQRFNASNSVDQTSKLLSPWSFWVVTKFYKK